ncbi:PREDICTED: CDK5 regulatory subunit-associated protein 3 [Habropoda laboriosa]|uniref:CDK5 regulatory subunit-associated protein 3 n=1 Tax=Habropoda laboriosa TaxID=597456 RepID=UPI00083DCE92|nr:PREDICTED: CDK5 regulatory subunit-associated protein 3 [Habropoda laboriosa]
MEEQNIPIDINAGKLLEWLVNRRHCNKDWHVTVLIIREKINNAIQDMPVHEGIAKLLSGSYINYYHCLKIVEILKETEADTKNVFGRYGSQRMKDWQEILRLYEKDNVYLAEVAQMLIRNVNYEIPSTKKQIQKLEQIQTVSIYYAYYLLLCKQMGIPGEHIKQELAEKVKELPDIYENIAKKTKSLEKAVEFYCGFVEYTLGRQHDGGCVPMVKYIIGMLNYINLDKGNTTTYEWIYGEAPLSVSEPPLNISLENDDLRKKKVEDANNIGIDFGEIDLNGGIDFGDDVNLDVGGEIDWGDGNVEDVAPGDIDYNISLEESGIVVEAAGHEGGTATGTEAYTVLDNPATRSDFINQLFELEAFLKLRLYEFKGDDSINFLSFSQLQDSSSILQHSTLERTQNMLDNVQVVISEILNTKVQHLHNIKHSGRYVDVLASSLKQKLSLVDKMITLQKTIKEKRESAADEANTIRPLLQLLIQKTKELQTEIEKDISRRYKNRVVHLTGGVNIL